MNNIILMKDSTIKSGTFTKTLREIMAETKEKARGLWYKAGASYSSMPTFKLKTSKNPMLMSLGNLAERYGVRIVATAALAAVGVGGIELLMHPEMAFAAEDVDLSNDASLDATATSNEVSNNVETTVNETVSENVSTATESTVDGNEIEGNVVAVEDTESETKVEEQTPFAADPSAEKADDDDFSDVDYHLGQDGKPILDYHYDDDGNIVIDATDEEIAEKMQEFKDGNTEPPTTEPDTTPDTTPKTTPDKPGEPEEPRVIPQTSDDLLSKTAGLTAMAAGALALFKVAKDKIFKADKVASSGIRLGVVNGRSTFERIDFPSRNLK